MSIANSTKRKRAPRKPKEAVVKGKRDDALHIVRKYIIPEKINYPRDMMFAFKLLEKFPERAFWEVIIPHRKVDSMAVYWAITSRKKLELEYSKFKKRIEMQKKLVIPEKQIYHVGTEKCGEDYVPKPHKPRSVLEFLK